MARKLTWTVDLTETLKLSAEGKKEESKKVFDEANLKAFDKALKRRMKKQNQ